MSLSVPPSLSLSLSLFCSSYSLSSLFPSIISFFQFCLSISNLPLYCFFFFNVPVSSCCLLQYTHTYNYIIIYMYHISFKFNRFRWVFFFFFLLFIFFFFSLILFFFFIFTKVCYQSENFVLNF